MDQSSRRCACASIFPRERAGSSMNYWQIQGLGMPKFVVEYEVPGAGSLTPHN